jgi:16S rRNA (uracil1498-N3)-methyltransferase
LRLPVIEGDATLREILAKYAESHLIIVLHEEATNSLSGLELLAGHKPMVIFVGPEGGITPSEIEELVAAGAEIVLIGENILRSAHAGFAAVSAISAMIGRW